MKRAYRLGLTGSVGMGKSTTLAMFAAAGIPVWDADAVVHELYALGGAGVPVIRRLCPEAVVGGAVDRDALRSAILSDAGLLQRIEDEVHPLVARNREAFLAEGDRQGVPMVVLDLPLLYETGADRAMDGVVVVSAPEGVQRQRVLSRPGMTKAALDSILARQMPDAEKRARATWVVETTDIGGARAQVETIIATIRAGRTDHA